MKYLVVLLLCSLWLLVFKLSGCELLDSPLGFVSGCMNHGVNWNAFLAPSGFFLMLLAPMAIIHLVVTGMAAGVQYIKSVMNKPGRNGD